MSKIVTVELFKQIFPKSINPIELQKAFAKYFSQYEINTTNRRSGFLAQCGHESNGFSVMKENLNYSAEGLLVTFPKYFHGIVDAQGSARQPEKIANRVYANRMGNGNEASGDGWKYKGSGILQITGHDNYKAFADYKELTLDQIVVYINSIEGAVESALWFWETHNLNTYCDNDDIIGLTKRVNGGLNGIEDRTNLYVKIKAILN